MLPFPFQHQKRPDIPQSKINLPITSLGFHSSTSPSLPVYTGAYISFSSQRVLPMPSSSMNGLFPPATSYSVNGFTSQNLNKPYASGYTVHADYQKVAPKIASSVRILPSPNLHVLSDNNTASLVRKETKNPVGAMEGKVPEDISPGRTSRPVSVSPKKIVNRPLLSPVKRRVNTSPTRRKHNRIRGERVGQRVAHIEQVLIKQKD